MAPQYSSPTRLRDYIAFLLPWAHGHQLKAIGDFVAAIIEQQTACQAQLARSFGKQEAALKRLSRLLHNERLDPRQLADAVLLQALHQLPKHGKVRLAIDWTIEADQHLLVVSLVVGRRAVPIYWRAYHASVLKGRMKRYELAVIRRAVGRVTKAVGTRRVIVTADRGFADVALFTLLNQLGITFIIRVKAGTHVYFRGKWCKLGQLRFRGHERHRSFGALPYCESCPQRLWVSKSRARDAKGHWGIWHVVSNRPLAAAAAANENSPRQDQYQSPSRARDPACAPGAAATGAILFCRSRARWRPKRDERSTGCKPIWPNRARIWSARMLAAGTRSGPEWPRWN